MAKPHSMDLRERVIAAVESGGMSCNRAALHFHVAISTVVKCMQRLEATGSVAPGQIGGHKPRKINGDHEAWLSRRIGESDFTLNGLVAELAERGLAVDYHTVWDFVHAAGFSFKKRRWLPASRAGRMSSAAGRNG
jgi:putative transposase